MGRLHRVDLKVFRRATTRPSPRIDRVLYPLSNAADHSKLWLTIGAALAARGGRTERRATIRGLLSVGATSLITNALVKPLASRPRPVSTREEWMTRTARMPLSTSFPSGHAASAAAFAVGAGIESPLLAAPLGLAALAVGWSRVRTRVHYPGDVMAGLILGAGIALATRRFWPVPPSEPVIVSPPRPRTPRAETDGARLGVVVNPSAGSAGDGDIVESLQAELPAAVVMLLEEGADLVGALNDMITRHDAIGVVGGDGSINAAAGVALGAGKPLAVFPGGTLNHFARDLGIASVSETMEAIRSESLGSVDVGLISGKPFLNTASFGAYAELVDRREAHEQRLGKWLAMALALVQVLRRAKPVEVSVNGTRRALWLIFIGNGEYGPAGLSPRWRTRLDDGVFDVRYVEDTGPYSRLRFVVAMLIGQTNRTNTYTRELLNEVSIQSHQGDLRLARDGETFDGPAAFIIRKSDKRLAMYVPPRPSQPRKAPSAS
jgi:undecaprenyl-diphosphatase